MLTLAQEKKQKWSTHHTNQSNTYNISLNFVVIIFLVVVFYSLVSVIICLYLEVLYSSIHATKENWGSIFTIMCFVNIQHVLRANWTELESVDGQINVDGRHLKIITINKVCVSLKYCIDDIKISHARGMWSTYIFFFANECNITSFIRVCVCFFLLINKQF